MPQPPSGFREHLLLVLIAVAGAAAFLVLFPRLQPSVHFNLGLSPHEALKNAEMAIAQRDLEMFSDRVVSLRVQNSLLTYLRTTGATHEQQQRLMRFRPAAVWSVILRNPTDGERYLVEVDGQGAVVALDRSLPTSAPGASLSQDDAEALARASLSARWPIDWSQYTLFDSEREQLDNRTDYRFTWQQATSVIGEERLRLLATIQGDEIGAWRYQVLLPQAYRQQYSDQANARDLLDILRFILATTCWFLALIVFAFRFRSSEVGIRNGVIVGLVFLSLYVAYLINTLPALQTALELGAVGSLSPALFYLQIGVSAFFTTVGVFIVWTSGESLARELWPSKLRAFDGLFAQHYLFPWLGRGILRGTSLGLAYLGLMSLVGWALVQSERPGTALITGSSEQQVLSAYLPVGVPEAAGSIAALLSVSFAFLFSLAFLKRYLKQTWIAVAITLVLFSIFHDTLNFADFRYTVLTSLLASWILYVGFFRYGLMTVFHASIVAGALPYAVVYLTQSTLHFQIAGGITVILLVALAVFGYVARARGVDLDEAALQPHYVRYITERERLKMELDIARRAQLRMLPSTIPETDGLNIAAFSEPAREVGGDYFDFFQLDEDKLGIAVGDVSGKGMPAALYMTMLKGFLQSRVDAETRPADILRHVNRKFYLSAEANMYVTLLFCIVDLRKHTLTFARAGHLPLLLHRATDASLSLMQPPGMGIGLERGHLFDQVIREETIVLQPGDSVLLYTDGLSEARNAQKEEWGTEALAELMQQHPNLSAEALLQHIREAHQAFVNGAESHDDLTCIVIKMPTPDAILN